MQTEKVRRGTVATTMQVVRNEGFMALYRGLSASLLRQITYSTVRFGAYDALKVWFGETEKSEGVFLFGFPSQLPDSHGYFGFVAPLTFAGKIGVGMISGGIGGLCGNPADVVNIRMQADGRLPVAERRNYKNAFGLSLIFPLGGGQGR